MNLKIKRRSRWGEHMPEKVVNGFHFMPPSLSAWIGKSIPEKEFDGHIPWTPLKKPLSETTFSLMTSAGINMNTDPDFNMDRERQEPAWGDPSYRKISANVAQSDIHVNHLHINTDYIKQDMNVMLPLRRFQEFEADKTIGVLAPHVYAYYGFQLDPKELLQNTMPQVVADMQKEGVEAVLLTPA